MKAVILAGGFGTRISEESHLKPKPMVEIGGKPILWHVMKIYSSHGIDDFIICLGYKGSLIKEYFQNYSLHNSDVTFDFSRNTIECHQDNSEPWKITLVDTGLDTGTAGRLSGVRKFLESEEDFCLTYGDGVANVDIPAEILFHKQNKNAATVCAVKPPGRYGLMKLTDHQVSLFTEKPSDGEEWINGGFFVLNRKIFDFISTESDSLEMDVLPRLVQANLLGAWKHFGYWQAMDTVRDKKVLERAWLEDSPPWKLWR
jgi:glucose-1-phosphate cytidylyltransferase